MPHSHATCHTGAPLLQLQSQSQSQSTATAQSLPLLSGHGIAPAYRSACRARRTEASSWSSSSSGWASIKVKEGTVSATGCFSVSQSLSLCVSLSLPCSLLLLLLPYWCQTAVRHVRATRIWNGALSAQPQLELHWESVSAAHSFVKYTPCVCAF